MAEGWENHEPAPLEFFHHELMEELRKKQPIKTSTTMVLMTMTEMNDCIAKVKGVTYNKYAKHISRDAIQKNEM